MPSPLYNKLITKRYIDQRNKAIDDFKKGSLSQSQLDSMLGSMPDNIDFNLLNRDNSKTHQSGENYGYFKPIDASFNTMPKLGFNKITNPEPQINLEERAISKPMAINTPFTNKSPYAPIGEITAQGGERIQYNNENQLKNLKEFYSIPTYSTGGMIGGGLGLAAGLTATVLTGGAAAPLIAPLTALGSKAGTMVENKSDDNKRLDASNKVKPYNNPNGQIAVSMLGDAAKIAGGVSGGAPSSGGSDFMDNTKFDANEFITQESIDEQIPTMRYGGMVKYSMGGTVFNPNAEVEHGELGFNPNGSTKMFNGDEHGEDTDGDGREGIQRELEPGTKILSNKLKMNGKTFADMGKKYNNDKYQKILDNPQSSKMEKDTANMMMKQNYERLESIYALQDQVKIKKGLPSDIDTFANGGKVKKGNYMDQNPYGALSESLYNAQTQEDFLNSPYNASLGSLEDAATFGGVGQGYPKTMFTEDGRVIPTTFSVLNSPKLNPYRGQLNRQLSPISNGETAFTQQMLKSDPATINEFMAKKDQLSNDRLYSNLGPFTPDISNSNQDIPFENNLQILEDPALRQRFRPTPDTLPIQDNQPLEGSRYSAGFGKMDLMTPRPFDRSIFPTLEQPSPEEVPVQPEDNKKPIDWEKYAEMAAMYGPTAYNLLRGTLGKKDQLDRREYTVDDRMKYRDINIDPALRAIDEQSQVANTAIGGAGSSTGAMLSRKADLSTNAGAQKAKLMVDAQNTNNQGRQGVDQFNIGMEEKTQRQIAANEDYNKRATAQKQSMAVKGLEGVSSITQLNKLMGNQKGADDIRLSTLNSILSNYDISPELIEKVRNGTASKEEINSIFTLRKK